MSLAVAGVWALAGAASGDEPAALGQIEGHGSVELQRDSGVTRLANSRYAYFPDEGIATGAGGSATLTLRDALLELAPGTAARVSGVAGSYRVALEKGAVRIRFGASANVEIEGVGLRSGVADPESSVGGAEAVAWRDAGESISLCSRSGAVKAERGGTLEALVSCEARFGEGADAPDVAAGGRAAQFGVAGQSGAERIAIGVAGVLAAGAVGFSVDQALDDDDDSSSPVK